jgi:glycosyltransferase involved in cell wall biosynthesis
MKLLHVTTPGPMGLAARYFASRVSSDHARVQNGPAGLRLVGSFHTNLSEYTTLLSGSARLGRVMEGYMRWLYGACETVLAPSQDTIDRLVARGWREERLSLWRRGVDASIFSPGRRAAALRERWGVDERRPAVLYAGRVSREKGLDLLVPLGPMLHRAGVEHRLVIVGEGPMTAELKARCPDAVFTGRPSHDDVAIAMASADVMVFPSETDTAGNVVLEAQASGLPVVVAAGGGPRENMRHGETGYVCRSGDAWSFCERLGELLRDPARRRLMSDAARRYAETRTWSACLAPVYSLYRTALASPIANPADRSLRMPARAVSGA